VKIGKIENFTGGVGGDEFGIIGHKPI